MLKFLIEAFKASKGRMPNNLEMLLLKQKAANQAIDERKIVNIFDRSSVNPNKPIMGGKNIPETEDDIRRRIMKQNKQGIKSLEESMKKNKEYQDLKKSFDDPEKKAMGGRIGYKFGTGKKGVEGLLNLIKNKFGKKAITTADKAPIPPKTLERDMFKTADKNFKNKRMLDDDEYQDFLDEVGGADQLEAYDFDGTVGDAKRIIKEQKRYMDDMELEYKKGNLDPEPGDKSPARKRFLEKKLEEMEASGDKRLMTVDEIEELSSFDLGSEMDVAKTLAPKMVERMQLKQKYPGITDDLLDKILIDDNMQRKAEVLATIDEAFKMMEKGKGADEILDTMKNVTRTKQAYGGRAGFRNGNTVEDKIKEMIKDFDKYRKGGGKISYKKFKAAYIPENFAAGGVAGLLGERPRYQTGGDVAFDASDASVYGSSAITVTPETVADAFGNQVQQEMGNTFNPPLIEDVIQEKTIIEDTNKQGIMQNEKISGNPNGVGVNEPTPMPDRPITNLPPALEDRPITNLPGAGAATNLPGSGAPGTENLMDGFKNFISETYGDGPMMSTMDVRSYRLPDGTVQQGSSTSMGRINEYLKSIGQPPATDVNSVSPLMQAGLADGGIARAGFAGGGMGRRGFLKLLGSLGAGAAAIKTGILGLGGKQAGKEVVKEVAQSAGSGRPPPYFFKLVEKIKFMGDDAVASQDKAIAKKYKDYVLEEDFAGNISITRRGDMDAPGYEEVYMGYSVDDVPIKGKKGSTKVEEYEEYTVRPDEDGKMKDVEDGVPDDVLDDAGDPDSMTLKKASGGIARMLGE